MGNHKQNDNDRDSIQKRVFQVSAAFSVPTGLSRMEAWQLLEEKLAAILPGRKEIKIDFAFYLTIAASLCIIALAAYTVYNFQHVHVLTGQGEHQLISLPDHSTVVLNAGSSLQYNTFLFALTRTVHFTGEAFFSVQKGNRFKVVSQQGIVEVLGTQFNILSRNGTYEVACIEGKVKVHDSKKISAAILTAGLHTTLINYKLEQPASFKPTLTSWKNGEFYFENSPLNEVLATLELQYDIKLHFDSSVTRSYSGYFTNDNLEESLKLVCLPLSLEYKFLNKREIKLSNKK